MPDTPGNRTKMSSIVLNLATDIAPNETTAIQQDGSAIALRFCEAINIILLVSAIWIISCMTMYMLKIERMETPDSGRMYMACFVAVCTTVPKLILDVIRIYLPNIDGALKYCETIVDIDYFLATVAIFSTYFFLWFRQKGIYAHPILNNLYAKWIKILSVSILFALIGASIGFACAYIIPTSYTYNTLGCLFLPAANVTMDGNQTLVLARPYVLGGLMILGQLLLLGLFIYPLTRSRRPSPIVVENDFITMLVRRCTICTAMATFSDLMTLIVANFVIPWGFPSLISHTMYNGSIFINAICILSTFGKNIRILTVFCRQKVTRSRPTFNKQEAAAANAVSEI